MKIKNNKKAEMKTNRNQRFLKFSSKRSEMKMMENIGIMFVFFILIALGFIFYARIGGHSAQQEQQKYYQQRAVKLAQLVSSLPEVRCSEENVVVNDCFDALRLNAFKELLEDPLVNRYYFDILSFSTIVIKQIYPENQEIILYNREPIDAETRQPEWSSMIPIQIPITLYNAANDQFNFGILEVGIYEK